MNQHGLSSLDGHMRANLSKGIALNSVTLLSLAMSQLAILIKETDSPTMKKMYSSLLEVAEKKKLSAKEPKKGTFVVVEKKKKALIAAQGQRLFAEGVKTTSPSPPLSDLEAQILSCMKHPSEGLSWNNIVGLDEAKETLKDVILLPTMFPEYFTGIRKPWRGILLFGPPGTGKTLIAEVVASVIKGAFFSVSSSNLISKWVGDSEKMVKTLFDMARAKSKETGKTSVIFIDEIDSLCSVRSQADTDSTSRFKAEFLVRMSENYFYTPDRKTDGILVIGATNLPWMLDAAFRRRFEKKIYIPPPDAQTRRKLLLHYMKHNVEHDLLEEDFVSLETVLEGFSAADIHNLVRQLSIQIFKEAMDCSFFFQKDGLYIPSLNHQCEFCPNVSKEGKKEACISCGAVQMSLTDIPKNKLSLRKIVRKDIEVAAKKNKKSLDERECKPYLVWNEQFGQDGGS